MRALAVSFLAAAAAYPIIASAWEYESVADAFDGAVYHAIRVESEPGSEPAVLSLTCEEGKRPYWTYRGDEILEGYPARYGETETSLKMSVDGKPELGEMVSDWPRSDDLKAAHVYTHKAVTKRLLGGRQLIVRTVAVVGTTNDAVFDITGLESALDELAPHCKGL